MVRAGYKETEIGVIPAEWGLCSIEHDFDFYHNNTYARDCMNDASGAVRNIHYGDVLIKYSSILDCATDSIPFINLGIPVNTANRTVQSGDIIMADTAEDETVGKAVEVINVGSKKIVSGLHTYFLRPHADLFAPRYLGYFINSTVYHNQLLPHIVGTKVSSISKKGLNETIVLRPPFPEQRRIAEALSDIDTLITNLEKLVAKKNAIKQGAMQLLLTGKKRLPDFTGEWVEKALQDIADNITMGQSPDSFFYNLNMRGLPLIQGNADIAERKTIVRFYSSQITRRGYTGDIIMTVRAPVGSVAKATFDCCLGRGVCAIKGNDFLYHLLVYSEPKWGTLSTGSTFDSISGNELKDVKFLIPVDDKEQATIAAILTDMDKEINDLSAKLLKYRNIKTGMMQALLTGQIRLLEQETPVAVILPMPKAEAQTKSETKPNNQQFDDAVAVAAIVNAFYSDKHPLGRKKVQKLLYLLRRRQDASTAAFRKKAAGPYADEVRYKGGEPIAKQNGYVSVESSNQGSKFTKGKNIGKALDYITKWDMQPYVDWLVAQFLHTKVDTLELLATIDMAMCDLEGSGITVSVDSVKKLIASYKEWRAKLKKTYFSDDDIGWAITECLGLFNSTGR